MATVDQDYVLGVGVQLQTGSMAELESQMQAMADKIKPIKVNITAQGATIVSEQMNKLSTAAKEAASSIDAVNSALARQRPDLAGLPQMEMVNKVTREQKTLIDANTAAYREQAAAIDSIRTSMGGATSPLVNGRTLQEAQALQNETMAIREKLRSMPMPSDTRDGGVMGQQSRTLERYLPQLNASIAAQGRMNSSLKEMFTNASGVSHVFKSMGNIAAWSIGAGVLFAAANSAMKGINEALHSQQEQVIQGFYYQGAGKQFSPVTSTQTMTDAIILARTYGQEVIHVQEAIGLWAKVTGGDLDSSLAATNEAMKLSAVTGMATEDVYRDTIGTLGQFHDALSEQNHLYNIAIGLATKYGGGIKMLGGESEDAARQMIQGMDAASAVVASFGMKKENAGAIVSTLIQLGGTDESGPKAGKQASMALASLNRGAPEEAMKALGISLKNNVNLIDQLGEKWDKVVPHMKGKNAGKTLGAFLEASVSSFAREPLDVIGENAKLIHQMVEESKKFESSDKLEALWKQLNDTPLQKLKDLQAGMEGVSITAARSLVPEIGNVAGMINTKFMPGLIQAAPELGNFAKSLQLPLGILAGWEAFKLAGSLTMNFVGTMKSSAAAMSALFNSVPIEEVVAKNALTDYQRALLSTLTVNGEVSAEMEVQFRTVAASKNVSVDSMIQAILREKGAIQGEVATIDASSAAIQTAEQKIASQANLTAEQWTTAMSTMKVEAVGAAEVIGTAFKAMMGPIGWVLAAVGVAPMVMGFIHDKQDMRRRATDAYDPHARQMDERHVFGAAEQDKRDWARANEQLHGGKVWFTQQGKAKHGGLDARFEMDLSGPIPLTPDQLREKMFQLAQDRGDKIAYGHSLQGPLSQDQIQASIARGEERLKSKYVTKPVAKTEFPSTTTPDAAAQRAADKAYADHLRDVADPLRQNIALMTARDAVDHKNIATAKLLIQHTNDHASALNNLNQAYNRAISDRQAHANLDQQDISRFNALSKSAKSDSQRNAFSDKANSLQGDLSKLEAEITNLKANKQVDVNAAMGRAIIDGFAPSMAAARSSLKTLSDGMKTRDANIPNIAALHKSLNDLLFTADQLQKKLQHLGDTSGASKMDAYIQTLMSGLSTASTDAEELKQRITDMQSTLSGGIESGLFELAHPGDKPLDKYLKAMMTLQKEYQKYIDLAAQAADPAGAEAQVNQWDAIQQAVLRATLAEEQYTQKANALRNTPTFAAITAGANAIGNTITSDIMGGWNTSQNNQINAIKSQIVVLENEKNFLSGRNSELEKSQLDQRIKTLQARMSGLQDQEHNPPFIKKMMQEVEKAALTGLTDRLKKDLQDAFVTSILGKDPKDITDKQSQNTMQFNTGVTNFGTAVEYMNRGIDSLVTALTSPGTGGGGVGSSGSILGSILGSSGGSGGGGGSSLSAAIGTAAAGGSILSSIGGGSLGSSGGSSFNFGGAGGSVPSGIGGGSSGGFTSGYNLLDQPSALAGLGMPSTTSPYQAIMNENSKSSGGSSGAGTSAFWANGKNNSQHIMGAIAGLSAAKSGYDQGGFSGSLESGLGMFSALTSMGVPPNIAIPIAAADFLFSLFHPHYNPSSNPDMFADSGFAQGVANAQGTAYTSATGQVSEDPGIKQQLGGMSQLQYLDAWYQQYPGGNGLNSSAKSLWSSIGSLTGGGKGVGIEGLHQGNVFVSDGQGHQVGESGNWETVLKDVDTYTNQLYALENKDMTGQGTWISVNSFGAGGGASASFSPWYTPGLTGSDSGAALSMPYPSLNGNGGVTTSVTPTPGSPSGGAGGSGGGGGYSGGGGASPMSVTTQVYLNSDVIAQQVNAFNIQRQSSGFAPNY